MGADPRRKAITVLATLALVITTYACGNDDDDDDAEIAQQPSTTAGPAPETATTTEPTETTAPTSTMPETTAPDTSAPDTTAPVTTAPADDPCAPRGTLDEYELNDRCDWTLDLGTELVNEVDDDGEPLVWGDSECEGMLAVPGELVFTMAAFDEASNPLPANVSDASQTLVDDLAELGFTADIGPTLTDRSGVVTVTGTMADVRSIIPQLQREDRSVDFNYFEAALPNNVFRPVDDPSQTTATLETFAGAAGALIAVVDSAVPGGQYAADVDGNGLVDEDNGHGSFVASIAGRSGAETSLIGIPEAGKTPAGGLLGSGRWAPMLFSDDELITALGKVGLETSIVNLSLGGVGCPSRSPGVAIGERLALAQAIDNMIMERLVNGVESGLQPLEFVAAAGNHGPDVPHFPAAWRRSDVLLGLANDPNVDPAAIPRIQNMQVRLADAITAVGSIEGNGDRSDFSNCGDWVNAAAYGELQIGAYQWSPSGFATWSGTSFAAANFTATLAIDLASQGTGTVGADVNSRHPITGAFMTGSLGLPCQ
jgi:hypothetical protein